jgi:hypothetical protein
MSIKIDSVESKGIKRSNSNVGVPNGQHSIVSW